MMEILLKVFLINLGSIVGFQQLVMDISFFFFSNKSRSVFLSSNILVCFALSTFSGGIAINLTMRFAALNFIEFQLFSYGLLDWILIFQ